MSSPTSMAARVPSLLTDIDVGGVGKGMLWVSAPQGRWPFGAYFTVSPEGVELVAREYCQSV
jgi:hypothetical protein